MESPTSLYYTLVRFKDTKTMFVATSSEVREFMDEVSRPKHPDDLVPDLLYDVFWQEGEGSFDGYYGATIICMAGKHVGVT